ncbi:retinoic acid-induced protein 1 [Rhinatrema bivittatum]|uniref:retinoic acid-induced protein 1 n=1 Tax=Rhinatrema bivittatum TaxID=194408 RepID=UPI001126235C|nr:retinoic acid-induced protein 1 [Rhinatrema bivittatum]XP_029432344.1 retinoic acid-induced protein 1 [Rhinatrema bivittatum]XP_029432345.1 retinoic acid-induced protein 1 [Rhinatrema bivittatum]XP_029432346.1 retinoic acid-induced protein 1 [Rhinatrema bivittatum]XP_029432347.1 retinoic acid-induced protein 1 [Rhinatrema bivittatum]XP_029432348.1 retinoic acid-induced protein 1 [Rhinatrema bivittatum]
MQSFRERCGFHGNQQNYQQASQDFSRLENYRHQSQPGLNCERQRLVVKEYYSQQSYQGYESRAADKYQRGSKQLPSQQLQARPPFSGYGVQENSSYPAGQYSGGEESLQNWGASQQQALVGDVAKYEADLMKKAAAVPSGSRQYQEPAGQQQQLPFRTHALHLPQQPAVPYPKLQRQKIQNDVSSPPLPFTQSTHFTQHSQTFPASLTYSSAQGATQGVHSYKSCTAPSNQHHERVLPSASMASGQRVQSLHAYQPNRIGYDQPQQQPQQQQQQQQQQQSLPGRHHGQETIHYQNLTKYQHYNQPGQTYCQSEAPVRTPEQYYQTFSPGSSHSPARSVGRSPSYSSTPSPLMPNLESFPYGQQSLNSATFPAGIADHSHFMPLLNPSPTDTSSPDPQSGNCKNLRKDKMAEKLLSDLSLQSLTALTSQVENISNTVQQLLSKSGMPQKKNVKNPARTPEQLKGQHCSPESSTYSAEQIGTPLSEPLGTPQSVHTEALDADYLSGSEEQLERSYLYCSSSRSPAKASNCKTKPESVSTCSVTSPDDMSIKSDDSFQSIHATLPLETLAKYVSNERACPQLMVSSLSQEDLSSEMIALQEAIDNDKVGKVWPSSPALEKTESSSSPFHLENHRPCLDPTVQGSWSNQDDSDAVTEALKLDKTPLKDNCKDFSDGPYENTQVQLTAAETKSVQIATSTVACGSKTCTPSPVSCAGYSCYSHTTANSMCSKTTDHFVWPDKSIESCLRWKELELSLNPSDLPKGLFQSKFVGSDKEKKNACHLVFQGDDPPMDTEPSDDFNKEEKEGESLSYRDASKTDSEIWLEDTRECCDSDGFQEISMIASPDLKESDLEPEDYSPLCDLTSLERKSVIYEASLPKSSEKTALSSKDVPEAASESMNVGEKENSVPSSHLSGQSVILLGPAVGTECKVKNWFESSLPHMKPEEETRESEDTDVEKTENHEATLAVMIKRQIAPEKPSQIKAEDLSKAKSLRSKRIPCRVLEGDECKEPLQAALKDLQAASAPDTKSRGPESQSDAICKSSHGQAAKCPSEGLPARMCTRSVTALADLKSHVPLGGLKTSQDKLTKRGAYLVKQKVGFKAGKRARKVAPKAMQSANDQNAFLLSSVVPQNSDPGDQKVKDVDPKNVPAKDQRSMILRSRTRTQELFHMKKRREKRTGDARHKHRKAAKKIISNNHVSSSAFKIPTPSTPRAEKESKRMKLPKSGARVGGKMSERPLHSLKRKSALISPIPAKKRSLILRSTSPKEDKSENPPSLFKKMSKKEKAKLPVRNSCKVILKSPAAKGTTDVCIKFSSRAAFQGPVKTKVLPPRKGRGLKLEAIVQKIASPNLKKFACTAANVSAGLSPAATPVHSNPFKTATSDTERAIRHVNVASTMGEARPLDQDSAQKAFVAKGAEQLCRNSTKRSLKGRLISSRKLPSECYKAEAYSSPETAQHSRGSSPVSKSVSQGPKRRSRKGKAAGLSKAKNPQEAPARASPPAHLTPKEGAVSGSAAAGEGKQPKTVDKQFPCEKAEGRGSQTRAQKRVNHASFNGYSKRQRKGLSRKKANSRARRRRQAPLVNPIEPEIKLKYVSCKPLRVDHRAKPFAPYVRVEKRNEFTTTCDVINSPGEESRFHLEQGAALAGVPAGKATLPPSSVMQLGPLVSKALNAGCLLCCLCRNPANYRDLGDLCGPYYPEDCLPKKKSKAKDRARAEVQGPELPPQPADRTHHGAAESDCAGGGKPPRADTACADPSKQSGLRSSTRGMFRKLQSCYCCDKKADGEETEKPKRHQCSKAPEPLPEEPLVETQEHWVHEACTVWTSGVYLIAGKLYGLSEAVEMAADVVCSGCQQAGASVGCCHKGCAQSYHYPCANDTGCLLSEENLSLKCLRHKRQAL